MNAIIDLYKLYSQTGKRPIETFEQILDAARITTIACDSTVKHDELLRIKLAIAMKVILHDDIADNPGSNKEQLLNEINRIAYGWSRTCLLPETEAYAALHNIAHEGVCNLPLYSKFMDWYAFDTKAIAIAMDYSYTLNKNPTGASEYECEQYYDIGICIVLCSTIDLMCCNTFNIEEHGAIRTIARIGQKIVQTRNMLDSWRNELVERDFSSYLVVSLLERGLLNIGDIPTMTTDELNDVAVPVIEHLDSVALSNIVALYDKCAAISSVNMSGYAKGIDTIYDGAVIRQWK